MLTQTPLSMEGFISTSNLPTGVYIVLAQDIEGNSKKLKISIK
jgi:hypothetical protein